MSRLRIIKRKEAMRKYMFKLSRTGWNNVIIFSVMLFILMINITNPDSQFRKMKSNGEEVYLLGEHAAILTLSINKELLIERIGRTWRATPAKLQGQGLEQMMLSWQQLMGRSVEEPSNIDKQMALLVTIDLAGRADSTVIRVYATEEQLFLFNQEEDSWLAVPVMMFNQLFPNEVFEN